MITVALLFLVSEGIRQSGTLGQVIKKLTSAGEVRRCLKAQLRNPSRLLHSFLPF